MEELLPYFERELALLRRQGREFAAHYPKLAAQLQMPRDGCADPHVERLIQSTAWLAARIAKRLDDDYPQFTAGLLEMLFPHYLRPFPACSVVRFEHRDARQGAAGGVPSVPRGTRLVSAPVHGTPCTFVTTLALEAAPVRIVNAGFVPLITPPPGIFPPNGATAAISITLDIPAAPLASPAPVDIFIDGEPSFCAALRDSLFMRAVGAYVEPEDGHWAALRALPISVGGMREEEALLPFPPRSHPAYRLLTEYFAFPEKFNFIRLDLAALHATQPQPSRRVTLHLMLAGLRHDTRAARLLESLSADNLLLGCTPVVNLFSQHGEPITVNQQQSAYPVRCHPVFPANFEVYSIASVAYRAQGHGERVVTVRPFYSLHHGEEQQAAPMFWIARRDDELAIDSPGHETSISLVDADFDPQRPGLATLSLELNCTNRDLPARLPYGQPDGDLHQADATDKLRIRLLRRPTAPCSHARGNGAHWRLISHLALNHHALSQEGLPAFREMLALYDVRQSPVSRRQIAGIVGLAQTPATTWLRHPRGASLAHGMALRLTLDEDAFVGSGMAVFVRVLSEFLALYVQANSFIELSIVSHQSGEELIRCKPMTGVLPPV
ncbi:type VI secretion system baseplate subunit TssF [Duganella callida]|uniref:Type VI secretion system baseplate subunit TssF n=1 Tax=Duganella callida TaxID=2561932 RepID=A0A4Y9SYS8_9BURK|nr:type VI secretion system baseplate subunit TssF [Duganella callida]TFW30374.1 type VI secretion system baseplate subunit TssF [Duganella callida]